MPPNKSEELDPKHLEQVQNIVLAFDRRLRSGRLYAANNPVLIRHHEDLMARLNAYLTEHDELPLTIEPFEVRYGDQSVYANENQQESFAFRLFNDGIRSVSFQRGIESSEMESFVDAVNRQLGDPSGDSDAVTAFWEIEFRHIDYTVSESVVDERTLDDKGVDEKLAEVLDPNMAHHVGGQSSGGDELYAEDLQYQDLKVTLNVLSVGTLFKKRVVLSDEELHEIQHDIGQCDRPERLLLDFADMVLAVLQEETSPEDFFRVIVSLGSALDNMLVQGRLDLALMLMEQIHQLPRRRVELFNADPNLMAKVLKLLWPPPRVSLLVQTLNTSYEGTNEDVESIIRLMDPDVLPHLLKMLPDLAESATRRLVCQGLTHMHLGDLDVLGPLLTSKETEIIRTGLDLAATMHDDRTLKLLEPLLAHPDPAVLKETIEVLGRFRSPRATSLLMGLVSDSRSGVRALAVRMLASSRNVEIATHLLGIVNRADFAQRPIEERRAFFFSVAKLAGDNFVPYLEGLLTSKQWFRKVNEEETFQLATFALAVIGTQKARAVLEEGAKSKNKTVKRLSETALRKIRTMESVAG